MMPISLSLILSGGAFAAVILVALAVHAVLDARALPSAPVEIVPPSAVRPTVHTSAVVSAFGSLARPESLGDRQTLEDELAQAGLRSRAAPVLYLASRAILAIAGPVVTALLVRPTGLVSILVVVLEGVAVGYYLPALVVRVLRSRRQRRIRHAFPNMLDMLVSCVEGGLGIDVALRHVAREIRTASPELGYELDQTNAELSAGLSRIDALRLLERRTGVAEIAALVNVLGVVERFGAGIAQSLRAHAQLTRRRRALDAERRAANASPMLTVTMILFILPTLFVVLLGSTIVNIVTFVLPSLQGG